MRREKKNLLLGVHLHQLRANQRTFAQLEGYVRIIRDNLSQPSLPLSWCQRGQVDGWHVELQLCKILQITLAAERRPQRIVTCHNQLKRSLKRDFIDASP